MIWEKEEGTNFIQNTHLQVVLFVIAPPTNGPIAKARAVTAATRETYFGNCSGGMASARITMVILYIPAPPIPWKARSMILLH